MSITKYLSTYSESEAGLALQLINARYPSNSLYQRFDYSLCLPCFDEHTRDAQRFIDFIDTQTNTLLVLVLNEPSHTQQLSANNIALRQHLLNIDDNCQQLQNLTLIKSKNDSAILLVERTHDTQCIPSKQGVGLARKIAADIVTLFIHNNLVRHPWIHCCDADSSLPFDYFIAINRQHNDTHCSAITYPFLHQHTEPQSEPKQQRLVNQQDIDLATQLYDWRLRQYVQGLHHAGSAYAFYALGSILAIHYRYYAIARGFPKRAGGEDFYLLNKLRKLGRIEIAASTPLLIRPRVSHRAPFGTGEAVTKLINSQHATDVALFYNPIIFSLLKIALRWLDNAYPQQEFLQRSLHKASKEKAIAMLSKSLADEITKEWLDEQTKENATQNPILSEQAAANNIAISFLSVGIEQFFAHSNKQCQHVDNYRQHAMQWFDGFKTLKWVHASEKQGLQKLSAKALNRDFGIYVVSETRPDSTAIKQSSPS
ncbi:hypothetical protein GYB62_01975, partial [bacterium]|nr:hypothetical protein [bacterium]